MLIANMYLWWFSLGWKNVTTFLFRKMGDALSFFSLPSLIRTLFAPYRQISATSTGTRIGVLTDRLVSRLVGATVRIFLMIAGLAVFITEFIVFSAIIICWPLLPFAPAVGIALAVIGVGI